jgi:hypothetical protein
MGLSLTVFVGTAFLLLKKYAIIEKIIPLCNQSPKNYVFNGSEAHSDKARYGLWMTTE